MTHREDYTEVIDESSDGGFMWDERWLAILVCGTCKTPSVYEDSWDEEKRRWVASLAYPKPLSAPRDVPAEIRRLFDEAVSALHSAPSLTAVGIRKCLEAVCDDRHAQGKDLAARIAFLSSTGAIPKTLGEMMDASRAFGNIGAHFGQNSVTAEQAKTLLEFTLAIFEYIYVAPAKIEAVRKSLQTRDSG